MKFQDISQDKKNLYTLKKNERCVFYMLNRNGEITFKLAGENAEAHIFSFFIGKKNRKGILNITQKHIAPRTTSRAIVKNILFDESTYDCAGLINISQEANQSDASQDIRSLLLSPLTEVSAKPSLEILTDDVKCKHSATASSLNPETLFFANSRGLSEMQATKLLIKGFFNDSIEKMYTLGISADFNFEIEKL